jgi:hypothetical protein
MKIIHSYPVTVIKRTGLPMLKTIFGQICRMRNSAAKELI